MPEQRTVEQVARTLYNATKGPGALSWPKLTDETRTHWFSLAIAALDLVNGARARMARDE